MIPIVSHIAAMTMFGNFAGNACISIALHHRAPRLLYPPNEVRGILWICDRRATQFSTDFLQIWYGGTVWLGHETYRFGSQYSSNYGHQGAKTKITLVNALQATVQN